MSVRLQIIDYSALRRGWATWHIRHLLGRAGP
jgi:hypothetical protein